MVALASTLISALVACEKLQVCHKGDNTGKSNPQQSRVRRSRGGFMESRLRHLVIVVQDNPTPPPPPSS